jgi:hypothetical protein
MNITDSPEFKKWFEGSKAVDAQGKPLKLYHGTSKDQDFKHFKIPKNGVWFTDNPKSASEYTEQNDSQGYRWDTDTQNFKPTNVSGRVMPVYLKMLKPIYVKKLESLFTRAQWISPDYRKQQGIVFDALRADGYDSIIMGDGLYVMLDYNAPNKIKSAIGNRDFSDKTRNIHASVQQRIKYYVKSVVEEAFGGFWITDKGKVLDTDWHTGIDHYVIAKAKFIGTGFSCVLQAYTAGWVRVSWSTLDHIDNFAVNFKSPMPPKARSVLLSKWRSMTKGRETFDVELETGNRFSDNIASFMTAGDAMNFIKGNW